MSLLSSPRPFSRNASFSAWPSVLRSGGLRALLIVLCAGSSGLAADRPRIDPAGIEGQLLICGGGELSDEIRGRFVAMAGGADAELVVVPTASANVETGDAARFQAPWRALGVSRVTQLHTRDRDEADDTEFLAPLRTATGVWFSGGLQQRIADAYVGTQFERELAALLKRGGVVGGTSAGAAIQSRVMIASGNPDPQISTGFDLLPGAIVDQHFSERSRFARLEAAVQRHPGRFGMGIDEDTAVEVQGRIMRVRGRGGVTFRLAAHNGWPAAVVRVSPGGLADLTSYRRAARNRLGEMFPGPSPEAPEVDDGSLVIIGGGGVPAEAARRFVELAGGPEALIVVLPTAGPDPGARRATAPRFLVAAGAKRIQVLPHRRLAEVESPEMLQALSEAGGVWFGGGRQWRFVDAYSNTRALPALWSVLERGGVIGGSSAGASIQGEYLARGHPLGNREIMATGYQRGFGFLPGTAIDQHFTQRKRQQDMQTLVAMHPQLLGIGIDESTALIVRGARGEVVGRDAVHFFTVDRRSPLREMRTITVGSGGEFDLRSRQTVVPAVDDREQTR